jgi:N-acyl-D-amino-acid deacylase
MVLAMASWAAAAEAQHDVVLRGGTVCDGSGNEPFAGDVVLRGQRILAVGHYEPRPGDRVIDCTGLVVAPGLIDLHTHSDTKMDNAAARKAWNYLMQGCTTMVTGNCGGGAADVKELLDNVDAHGCGTNIIHLVPHGPIRQAVVGSAGRAPTAEELQKMADLVEKAMRDGAFGMSTGLIYAPGTYAKTDELVALAKVVAAHGGIYASHMRDEGDELLRSVREIITIGRRAGLPVHISHFKAMGIPNWGRVREAVKMVEQARAEGVKITADQYPYTASATSLSSTVLLPKTAIPGGVKDLYQRMAADPKLDKLVRGLVATQIARSRRIVVCKNAEHPECGGKSLQEIAQTWKTDPVEAALRLMRDGKPSAINHTLSEGDVRFVMTIPWVATASDGAACVARPAAAYSHPRAFGTQARKIGYYAIQEKVVSLPFAIRSCTGLPADIFGLGDRGYLRAGCWADVVVFDPKTYRDTATYDNPQQYATGVRWVFLAGQPAIADGKPSDKLFGRAIRHAVDGPVVQRTGRGDLVLLPDAQSCALDRRAKNRRRPATGDRQSASTLRAAPEHM